MVEQAVDKASNFYMDLFTLEWQKMVLPVLMVLILSASALSTMDLKNSDESEQLTELGLETFSNLTEAHMKMMYFNDSVNQSQKALSEEISEKADRRRNELISDRLTQKGLLANLQKLGFFPYTPEHNIPIHVSEKNYLRAATEVSYRQRQFNRLDDRLNSSENMSLAEFEDEVQEIKSVDWRSEEVKDHLRNYSLSGNVAMGGPELTEEIRDRIIEEDFTELSFTAYLPSILATFLIYYVVNAVAVQSGRKALGQIKASRRKEQEESGEEDEETEETDSEEDEEENRQSAEDEGTDSEDEEDENIGKVKEEEGQE